MMNCQRAAGSEARRTAFASFLQKQGSAAAFRQKSCFSGFSTFLSKQSPSAQLYFGLDDSIFPEKQNICGGESGRIERGMESVKEAQLYSANGLSFIHPLPLSHAHSALTIERAGSRRRRRESSSAASTVSPSSKDSRKGTSFIQ